jgi:hypothetical protein
MLVEIQYRIWRSEDTKIGCQLSQLLSEKEYHKILREKHTFPLFWDVKNCPVTTGGIITGHKWWIYWERICDICVDWTVKSVHLPIGGYCKQVGFHFSKFQKCAKEHGKQISAVSTKKACLAKPPSLSRRNEHHRISLEHFLLKEPEEISSTHLGILCTVSPWTKERRFLKHRELRHHSRQQCQH